MCSITFISVSIRAWKIKKRREKNMTWVSVSGKTHTLPKKMSTEVTNFREIGGSETSQNWNGREIEIHETPEGPPGVTTQKKGAKNRISVNIQQNTRDINSARKNNAQNYGKFPISH